MISYIQREDLQHYLLKQYIFVGLFWSINNTRYCSTPVTTLKNMFLTDSLPPPLSGDSGIMHSVQVLSLRLKPTTSQRGSAHIPLYHRAGSQMSTKRKCSFFLCSCLKCFHSGVDAYDTSSISIAKCPFSVAHPKETKLT